VLLPNSKVRTELYRFPMQLVFNFTGDIVLFFLMIPDIEIIFQSVQDSKIFCVHASKRI